MAKKLSDLKKAPMGIDSSFVKLMNVCCLSFYGITHINAGCHRILSEHLDSIALLSKNNNNLRHELMLEGEILLIFRMLYNYFEFFVLSTRHPFLNSHIT